MNGSSPYDLSGNANNGVNNGATTGVTGILLEAFDYNGAGDYCEAPNQITGTGNFCIVQWVKGPVVGGTHQILGSNTNAAVNDGIFLQLLNSASGDAGELIFYVVNSGGTLSDILYTGDRIDDNTFHQIITCRNGSAGSIYMDGVLKTTGVNFDKSITGRSFYIAKERLSSSYLSYDGIVDEWGMYDRMLNDAGCTIGNTCGGEIAELWNGGIGLNPYNINFIVNLKDYYTNANLTNFSAFIGNDEFNDNNTGEITTNITKLNTSLFNITFVKTDYFNNTYENYNVTTDLVGFVNSTNLTLRIVFNNTNITANVSNTLLQDLNYSVNFTSSDGFYNINPPSGENITFTISCNRSVFESRNVTLNFSVLDENEYIIYVEPTFNSVTFYDATNLTAINNATVTLTYPSGQTNTLTTNSSGTALFSYVYLNETEFGNYSFELDKIGYTLINVTAEINSSNVPIDLFYNISRANLHFNIYDRETGLLLNTTNVTVSLIDVFDNVTDNGTFSYNNISLISQTYTVQASATGYVTEQATFDFTNQENVTVNLYLLNATDTNTGNFFVSVLNQDYFKQSGARVNLLEYSGVENGFITVSQCETNINGECSFVIELNVKTYIAVGSKIIEGSLFSAQSSVSGEIIKTDNEIRTLILRTTEGFVTTSRDNLLFNITETFVNNVSSIIVYFNTLDNTPTTVCVEYFEVDGLTKTSLVTNCTTSTSGIANFNTQYSLNRSKTYLAKVYNTVGTSTFPLDEFNYPSVTSTAEIMETDGYAPYIVLICYLVPLGLALYLGNINIFFIPIMPISWILFAIFPQVLLGEFVAGITMICSMGIWIARKKNQGG